MRQDPVTGALQTDEQAAAADAQAKEGFFARFEGRLNQIHERITAGEKAAATEKTRVDAIEAARKVSDRGQVAAVAEHLSQREGNLVIVTTELRADFDRYRKDFDDLVSKINGLQPGFFTQPPPPPKPVVPEKVLAPPPRPLVPRAQQPNNPGQGDGA